MELSFAELPQWAGIALAAGIAAIVGAFVGMWVARGRGAAEPHHDPAPEERIQGPIGRENPAFRNLQEFLRAKGIGAKEQDTRLREFASEYNVIHRKLRDMIPIGEGLADSQRQALAALEALEASAGDPIAEGLAAVATPEPVRRKAKKVGRAW